MKQRKFDVNCIICLFNYNRKLKSKIHIHIRPVSEGAEIQTKKELFNII